MKALITLVICILGGQTLLAQSPSKQKQRFENAIRLLEKGELKKGKEILHDLVEAYPLNALYWFNLGNAFFKLGRYSEAIQPYRNVQAFKSELKPVATLYLAKVYQKLNQLNKARQILSQLRSQSLPVNLATEVELEWKYLLQPHLKAGIEYYQQGEYEKSIRSLEKSIKTQGNSEAYLMKGLALVKLGKLDEAKKALKLAESKAADARIQKEASQLFKKIETKEADLDKVWTLHLEYSLGYNSNIFGDAKEEGVVGRPTTDLFLLAGSKLYEKGSVLTELNYTAYWEELIGRASQRFFSHKIGTSFSYSNPKAFIRIFPFIQQQVLGPENFAFRAGFNFSLERRWHPVSVAFQYELGKNFPAHTVYNYFDGLTHSGNISVLRSWEHLSLTLAYTFRVEDIGDLLLSGGRLPLAYNAHGPRLSLDWQVWRTFELAMGTEYLRRNYRRQEQPSGIRRLDCQFRLFTRALKRLNENLKMFIQAQWIDNESTLGSNQIDNKNFNQWTGKIGLEWDILP